MLERQKVNNAVLYRISLDSQSSTSYWYAISPEHQLIQCGFKRVVGVYCRSMPISTQSESTEALKSRHLIVTTMGAPVAIRIILLPLRTPFPVGISPSKGVVALVLPASKIVLLVRGPSCPRHRIERVIRKHRIWPEVVAVTPGHSHRSSTAARHKDVWALPVEEILQATPVAVP